MTPPPRALSFLGRLNTGSMLLRYLFMRQARSDDQHNYRGPFFNKEVLPWYEAAFNKARYAGYVELLIRHCQAEGIFLVIILPGRNYLSYPARSVYRGPAGRQGLALTLFQQAFRYKYFERDLNQAEALLDQLDGFCGFADLYYELGDIYYTRGDFDKARQYLRKAKDAAGMPTVITSEYRNVLRELARKYEVPLIDMDEIITKKFGAKVPDFSVFLDDCHLKPGVYEALSREIIRVLREHKCPKLELPEKKLELAEDEWGPGVGLTEEVVAVGSVKSNQYIVDQAYDSFLRLPALEKCLQYYPDVRPDLTAASEIAAVRVPDLKRRIETERNRLRNWGRQ
jgi:hypothetical protein